MTIGAAIFLASLGAILRYAVNDSISGIDLAAVGTILMVAGVVGLVAGIGLAISNRDGVVRERERIRDDRY